MEVMPILPRYCSYLHQASHELYLALETARMTPATTQEDFEKVIGLYEELGDLIMKIEARETQR